MTDEREEGEIEESPERTRFDPGIESSPTPANNHVGNQRNSRKRPFEAVDDAPTPESVKRAKSRFGQPIAPVPKLQLPAKPATGPPAAGPLAAGPLAIGPLAAGPLAAGPLVAGPLAIGKSGTRPGRLEPFMNVDFLPGYIIKAPFHETMMNPNPNMNDPKVAASVAQSSISRISSKQRPAIVLAAFADRMLVMPTATRGGRDLSHLPDHIKHEYIGIREYPNEAHLDLGIQEHSLLAYMAPNQSLSENSAVRLSHVATTIYREDIKIIGALSEDSTKWLIAMWLNLRQDVEDKGWERDRSLLRNMHEERRERNYTSLNNQPRQT